MGWWVGLGGGSFFFGCCSGKNQMLGCDVAPLHTEALCCCGFGKDLGLSDVKGGKRTRALELLLLFTFTGLQDQQRKGETRWREEAVCTFLFSVWFFLQTGSCGGFGLEELFLKTGSVLKPNLKIRCLSSGRSTGCYSIFTSALLNL